MKLNAQQIESFLKQPSVDIFLLYGPDEGLVRERSTLLAKQVSPNLSDAFQVSQFSCDTLKDTPSQLHDEAYAQSLLGGKKVIWAYDVSDKYAKPISSFLETYPGGNRIILQAGDLNATSKLRKLAEKLPSIASIPCYHDEGRKIGDIIRHTLQKNNMNIDQDAFQLLEQSLGEDRSLTRQTMEKLYLYTMGDTMVTLEAVQDIISDHANLSLDDLFYALLDNDSVQIMRILEKLLSEATAEILILRSLQNQFLRLYKAKGLIEDKTPPQSAISSLRPPIFFKYKSKFLHALSHWSVASIESYLNRLMHAELQIKSGVADGYSILSMAFLEKKKTSIFYKQILSYKLVKNIGIAFAC